MSFTALKMQQWGLWCLLCSAFGPLWPMVKLRGTVMFWSAWFKEQVLRIQLRNVENSKRTLQSVQRSRELVGKRWGLKDDPYFFENLTNYMDVKTNLKGPEFYITMTTFTVADTILWWDRDWNAWTAIQGSFRHHVQQLVGALQVLSTRQCCMS